MQVDKKRHTSPEVKERYLRSVPFPLRFRDRDAYIAEAFDPCSRFKPGYLFNAGLDTRITQLSEKIAPYRPESFVLTGGLPRNWSLLLEYLYKQGITSYLKPSFYPVAGDLPHTRAIYLPAASMADSDGVAVDRYGFGSTSTVEESLSKAVGELLERYYLARYDSKRLLHASPAQMEKKGKKILDIKMLNDFLPWQKKLSPRFNRDENKELAWVEGVHLPTGKRTHIPAQLVFWNYDREPHGESILAETNTNGGAGHFTPQEALVSGLLEIIQRDGFLIYWLNKIAPHRLDVTTISHAGLAERFSYLKRYRLECHILDITTDVGVPSCLCVLVDKCSSEPSVAIGAGTGFDLVGNIEQAIGEALSIHAMLVHTPRFELPPDYRPFSDRNIGRKERLAVWKGADMVDQMTPFLSGKLVPAEAFMHGTDDIARDSQHYLSFILERLALLGDGYDPSYVKVKSNVLDALGYHVVKVVVPKLVSIYLREHAAPLAAERLRSVPIKLGHTPAESFNPLPHPFP